MSDKHEYVDSDGTTCQRIFFSPNTAIDSSANPHSEKQFSEVAKNKKMNVGDMWDYSKELSEKRGVNDPIKVKYNENYSKKRRGTKSPDA